MNDGLWPLFARFPQLATIPHIDLRTSPTPVEQLTGISPRLWIKRDDLTAEPIGGNKVRSLEFLLANLKETDCVTTIGARASTHALVTAVHARNRARSVRVGTWPQATNETAAFVAARLPRETRVHRRLHALVALGWTHWRRMRGDVVIPAGGTSPAGILGHVNGALELADQITAGILPAPAVIVVPLGTGGTAVGLSIGLGIAGLRTRVVGVRVVPRIVARRGHLRRLGAKTVALIEEWSGLRIRRDAIREIDVDHSAYAGGYARPLAAAGRGKQLLRQHRIDVDDTYSAKAFTRALHHASMEDTLFWLTFDSRWMQT